MSFICPNCGTEVEDHASSCPECGSDERTGWSENTLYDDLDLPDEAYGDDHDVPASKGWRKDALVAAIALFLLLLFILRFVFGA